MRKALALLVVVLAGAIVVGGCGQPAATEAEQKQSQVDQQKSPELQ